MSRVTGIALDVHPSGAVPSTVSSGAVWTYGSWVQVIASAGADLHIAGLVFSLTAISTQFEVQIGVGGAGVEAGIHTWRGDIRNGSGETKNQFVLFPVPLGGVASGARVSVRLRSASSFVSAGIGLTTYSTLTDTDHLTSKTMVPAPTGANSALITPSATPWAFSAWTELSSGVSVETCLLGIVARGAVEAEFEFEIGFGASGSEVPKTMIRTTQGASTDLGGFRNFYLPAAHPIPPNTRVAIRLRKTGTSTTAQSVAMLYLNDTDTSSVVQSASEAITVTDVVTAQLTNDIYLTVFETITLAESVTLRPSVLLLLVFETIGLVEDAIIPGSASVFDRILVRDFAQIAVNVLVIRVFEAIAVSDSPLNLNPGGNAGTIGPQPSAPPGTTGLVDYWVAGL